MPHPAETTLDLTALRASLAGTLVTPADDGYDTAREVANAAVDRRPAVVVRAASVGDVAHAIAFARDNDLPLAVRGGGHGAAGHAVVDDGLVLDTAAMDRVEIDVAGRTAWAEAGVTAGAYSDAVGEHGLATGFGDTGSVGVPGITLGGGIGWLVRKHGLTIDSLLAAELVTADGELLHVDAEHHPDLFWALRGGGGNFGVVTRLRFRLHEVGTVLGGMLMLPVDGPTLERFALLAGQAPEELSIIANVMPAPPAPFVPAEHHGRPVLMLMLVHAGDPEAGRRALEPIRALGTPIVDTVEAMPYPQIYALGEGGPGRAAFAVDAWLTDRLDGATAENLVERVRDAPLPMRAAQIRVLGGAVSRVADDATAFAHRGRQVMVVVAAMGAGPGDAAALDRWIAETASAAKAPGSGTYVNFLGDGDPGRLGEVYPPATLARLREVKRRYDPENVFRGNHNIAPDERDEPRTAAA